MTLVLEIEYVSGVSFAAVGPDTDAPDWPPQPDRVFSALTATWAARGERQEEAAALEWLEKQLPPSILASSAVPRTSAIVFVPPNDPRSDRQKHAKGVLPALRSRQPRRFPAVRPESPVVRLMWNKTGVDETTLSSLQQLARDTSYVGHSASLTRCCFFVNEDGFSQRETRMAERRIYPGRFSELRRAFGAGRRPAPGSHIVPAPIFERREATVFSDGWLILEHIEGEMPDVRACALVAKTLRDALLSGYRRTGRERDIPELISGHAPDGAPTRTPHLAIVPMAFAGFPYADGHVLGFALVPPRESDILADVAFREVLRTLAPVEEVQGRRCLPLGARDGSHRGPGFFVSLAPTIEASRRSLDPILYTTPACTFATVTPIVLDRHLKEDGERREKEIATQIVGACRNIGLPEPVEIVADKHSAFEGVPSAYPSGKSPDWMRWRLPSSVANRQLTHAVVRFGVAVAGPVILGAGRFIGLGLCRPLDAGGR